MARAITESQRRARSMRNIKRALALATDPTFKRLLAQEYQQAYFRALGRFQQAAKES